MPACAAGMRRYAAPICFMCTSHTAFSSTIPPGGVGRPRGRACRNVVDAVNHSGAGAPPATMPGTRRLSLASEVPVESQGLVGARDIGAGLCAAVGGLVACSGPRSGWYVEIIEPWACAGSVWAVNWAGGGNGCWGRGQTGRPTNDAQGARLWSGPPSQPAVLCLLSLHLVAWSLETELTHMRNGRGDRV